MLAFVTSRLPSEPAATDVILREEDPDFEQTGLKVSSALRLHRVVTVSTSLMKPNWVRCPQSDKPRWTSACAGCLISDWSWYEHKGAATV